MEDLESPFGQAPWFDDQVRQFLLNTGVLSRELGDLVAASPLEMLVQWISKLDVNEYEKLERWLPDAFFNHDPYMHSCQLAPEIDLSQLASDTFESGVETALDNAINTAEGKTAVALYKRDTLAFASQVVDEKTASSRFAVVLDNTKLGRERSAAWRAWLHLSNWP